MTADSRTLLRYMPATEAWLASLANHPGGLEAWLQTCPLDQVLAERQGVLKELWLVNSLLHLRATYAGAHRAPSVESGSLRERLLAVMAGGHQEWRTGDLCQTLQTRATRLGYVLRDLVEEGVLQHSGHGLYRLVTPAEVVQSALRAMGTP